MDLNATIDIIIKDLNDIKDIVDDLKHYQGVPALEVELAKSKCRSVIEIITLMKNIEQKIVYVREERHEERHEILQEKEQQHELIAVESTPIMSEEKPQEKYQPEIIAETLKETKPPVVKPAEFTIIADQFSNRPESFNQTLGGLKHDDDIFEMIKTKSVTNLAEAIGINDKFLFIREIFNGDQESYDQALLKLDSAGNLEDAKATILAFAGENKENEAVKLFMSILKRKFPVNE
jgi:hypothetical protein